MFVQVIQGQVPDAGRVRAAFDDWYERLSSDAVGWLGGTSGVTGDGRFVSLVRFESEEAARRNSERPEQGEWWSTTVPLFDGEATFRNSTRVDADVVGDPDRAGFVQVIQGRTSDPERARQLMGSDSGEWARFRPEILGTLTAEHEDGGFTTAIYFTSEQEAREGERKEPPPELRAQMEEMNSLTIGTPEFFDLTDPWRYAPR
jgi:hypothetical protein